MDTLCTPGGVHSKYRAALTSSSFYQPAPFCRPPRQNDYNYGKHNRHSALLYHKQTRYNEHKSKIRLCSTALAAGAFVVLVLVLAVAGLALYIGVLHSEIPDQILSFSCSAKITRGDRFVGPNTEIFRKYHQQLDILYRKSIVGSSLMSVILERFADDGVTIHFRLSLNKNKLPRTITNIEKALRDILINDALKRKPVFRGVRFDTRSVQIKQTSESNSLQRIVTKPVENVKLKGTLIKPTTKHNLTEISHSTIKKKPVVEEPEFKEEDLPVIQGSFHISKTEADITEKKKINEHQNYTPKSNVTKILNKPTTSTSLLQKNTSTRKNIESTTPISTTIPTTTTVTTVSSTPYTISPAVTTNYFTTPNTTINNILSIFRVPVDSFDKNGWIPIDRNPVTSPKIIQESVPTVSPIQMLHKKQPVYTSFTNPGLSYYYANRETLGSTTIMKHPLPVDKIAEITEIPITTKFFEDNTIFTTELNKFGIEDRIGDDLLLPEDKNESLVSSPLDSFVEVETLKYVPTTTSSDESLYTSQTQWEHLNVTKPIADVNRSETFPNKSYNNTLQAIIIKDGKRPDYKMQQAMVLRNLSSIFHNLASSLGFPPVNFTTDNESNETSETIVIRDDEEKMINTEEPSLGEGQVEVVDGDEESLIIESHSSTKLPLVTLMPVKSNSGILRPLRPRPTDRLKLNTSSLVENRSFPSNIDFDFSKRIKTEVVTSVSTEINKIKIPKNKLNKFNIIGELNFEQESTTTKTSDNGFVKPFSTLRNPKIDNSTNILQDLIFNSTLNPRPLTEDKLEQLAEISKINSNLTGVDKEAVISNKAVSASFQVNQVGFKLLTKTFNKIPSHIKEEEKRSILGFNVIANSPISNKTECNQFTVKCGDGQCLPDSTRCNQLVDCNDGADEKNCNCADYLKSQYLLRKICDGIVDCWDFSDENQCEWCKPGQYVCRNSKFCIDKMKICDGIRDCPNGDDERQCIIIAPNAQAADEFPYNSEGFLFVRKHGKWKKVCADNIGLVSDEQSKHISVLGQAICKAMTYRLLSSVKVIENTTNSSAKNYYELSYSFGNITPSLTFKETLCKNGKGLEIQCKSLDCGVRPHVVKQLARIVGGGNAGLGSWPWQAALYKEGEFQCGASLISDKWLLSAGHCFFHSLDEHWVARLGALRRGTSLPSPYEQLRPIVQIIIHPGYIDAGFINDISILQMESKITFSDYVRPICLPQENTMLKHGKICTVIGWGQLFEVGRIFPDTLQEVQVPIISTPECRKRTAFLPLYKVTDDMFCAGFERGGRDACLGDSGGPLMCSEPDGRWILQGITSNGYGCARANRPGVYTKVSNYLSWIQSHIQGKEDVPSVNKTKCMGYRCPLGECLPRSRLCNGYIECSDGSDEKDCI